MSRLTVDDKHYLFNRDNLGQPVHMGLPEKQKTFSQFFFFSFLKSILNLKHFPKKRKMSLIADVFWEIAAP